MNKQNKFKLEHIGRVYEAAKDGVYKGDQKAALDNLQELRNIACEQLQQLDALSDDEEGTTCVSGYLECIFGKKLKLGLDYLHLLLFNPTQRLPVIVLSSEKNGVGKTYFAKFLDKLLPLDSVAFVTDMDQVFTENMANKRLWIIDEGRPFTNETRNKLRTISTCDKYVVKRKWRRERERDFSATLLFITNDPGDLIEQLDGQVPYWHIQIHRALPKIDLTADFTRFLSFLRDYTLSTEKSTPTWFSPGDLR